MTKSIIARRWAARDGLRDEIYETAVAGLAAEPPKRPSRYQGCAPPGDRAVPAVGDATAEPERAHATGTLDDQRLWLQAGQETGAAARDGTSSDVGRGAAKPRLLHLDDEPEIRLLVKTVAEACGYEVSLLSRPAEFRETCRAFAPDLVLLDLIMPGADGIEVLGWIAEEASRVRILLLSGYDLVDQAARLGRARGLDLVGSLQKPLRVADLRAKLTETHLAIAAAWNRPAN